MNQRKKEDTFLATFVYAANLANSKASLLHYLASCYSTSLLCQFIYLPFNFLTCHVTSLLRHNYLSTSLACYLNTFATLVYLATYCCCSGRRLSPRRIWTTIFCPRPDGGTYRHQRYFHPSPARQWTRGQQEQIEQQYTVQGLTHRVITPTRDTPTRNTRLFLAQNMLSWWGNLKDTGNRQRG